MLTAEMETHISMEKTSDKMLIYTTEPNVMRKLDKFVEESDEWNLIEVGKCKGEIVSKTYEAPRKLMTIRKKSAHMSEENKQAARERLKLYHERREKKIKNDAESTENTMCDTTTANEEDNFEPERIVPEYETIDFVELVR